MKSHLKKIQFLLDINADVCVIHAQFVDRPRESEEIKGLKRFIDEIREHSQLAEISTHKISTIELCENKN